MSNCNVLRLHTFSRRFDHVKRQISVQTIRLFQILIHISHYFTCDMVNTYGIYATSNPNSTENLVALTVGTSALLILSNSTIPYCSSVLSVLDRLGFALPVNTSSSFMIVVVFQ